MIYLISLLIFYWRSRTLLHISSLQSIWLGIMEEHMKSLVDDVENENEADQIKGRMEQVNLTSRRIK